MVVEFGAQAVEQLEEFAALLGLDKLRIYTKDEFLLELKRKYVEYQAEQQVKEQEAEQKFYGQILKKLPRFGANDEYSEALAVLDNYIV